MDYNKTQELYVLLNSYNKGTLNLFELLDESLQYFDGLRGVCSWLTSDGKIEFDGYHFDDLYYYYKENL